MTDEKKPEESGVNPNGALGRHADFDTTPVVNKDGLTILSQDIRDEQERHGYVADIQPKAVPIGGSVVTSVSGTAPHGVGAMQATGNVVVAAAASVPDSEAIEAASPVPGLLGVEGGAKLPKDAKLPHGTDPNTVDAAAAAKDSK